MNPSNSLPDDSATRRGKIARLPLAAREELNRRLQNGEEGRKLLDWLNSRPETQAILQAQFDGKAIAERALKINSLMNWTASAHQPRPNEWPLFI